jgi:hypothetical protein
MKKFLSTIAVIITLCFSMAIYGSTKNETYILNEESRIDVMGKKTSFISIKISKKVRVKIKDEQGLKRFSNITLPETFDPTYFAHFSRVRNYQFALSELKIISFNAFKKNASGQDVPLDYKGKYKSILMERGDDQGGNYDTWEYKTDELSVGDELLIEYEYTIPFDNNFYNFLSSRVFFHDNLLKEKYSLKLTHYPSLNVDVEILNGATADSVYNNNGQYTYKWERSNLMGCVDEVGARPYTQLPHIVFAVLPLDLIYKVPDSFKEKYIPTYAFFASRREDGHMVVKMSMDQGVRTTDLDKFYKYVDGHSSQFSVDDNGYQALKSIHTDITERFTYDNDRDNIYGNDNRKDRLGTFLDQGVVRETNRYTNYVAIARRLKLHYFTSYLSDIRTGELGGNFYTPMLHSDYLIAVVLKDYHLQYIYPKNSNFGYYINELPFYFENAKSRLIQPLDYLVVNVELEEKEREVTIFSSTEDENIRRTNVLVKVDLANSTLDFQAKIDLTGQFSTITRGIYQKDVKSPKVNKLYNEKLWSFDDAITLKSQKFVMKDKQFPYQANINAEFSGSHLIQKNGNNYAIDMANWFQHVIYENMKTEERHLDFYSDFKAKDSYVYYFQFAGDVSLKSTSNNVSITNEYGVYNFTIDQINPKTIKVTSFYEVNSTKIVANQINEVGAIFKAIENTNGLKLEVQKN